MGGVLPVAFQALQAFQTIGTVAQFVDKGSEIYTDRQSSDLTLSQLQDRQRLDEQQLRQATALDKKEIIAQSAKADLERRRALKKAVAKQRAAFGGSGVSSGDGSSEAVLLGLFEETDADKESSDRFDQLKLQALNQQVTNTNRTNTLKRTQLVERQKISNTSNTIGDIAELFKIF